MSADCQESFDGYRAGREGPADHFRQTRREVVGIAAQPSTSSPEDPEATDPEAPDPSPPFDEEVALREDLSRLLSPEEYRVSGSSARYPYGRPPKLPRRTPPAPPATRSPDPPLQTFRRRAVQPRAMHPQQPQARFRTAHQRDGKPLFQPAPSPSLREPTQREHDLARQSARYPPRGHVGVRRVAELNPPTLPRPSLHSSFPEHEDRLVPALAQVVTQLLVGNMYSLRAYYPLYTLQDALPACLSALCPRQQLSTSQSLSFVIARWTSE